METQLLLTPRAMRVDRTELCIMALELLPSFMNVLMVLKVLDLNLRDYPSVAKPTLHGHEADAGTRRTGEPAVRLHVGSFHHLE
jgi:hypothetical protein